MSEQLEIPVVRYGYTNLRGPVRFFLFVIIASVAIIILKTQFGV